ncbi:MAG: flagellar basal body L-ring protein, partial [Alphaproteobacteria bacterium]|nr:flagellar basal body L-ring protein [Alphaproteobacteria bacterium]
MRFVLSCLACWPLMACDPLSEVGRAPGFTPPDTSTEHAALYRVPLPEETQEPDTPASLWSAGQRSLLGDRRASKQGDILTVVIEIDDSAQISNSTARGRNGTVAMPGPSLFGVPQAIDRRLPGGVSIAAGADVQGSSDFSGTGSVSRNEQLTLRVASTVVERLP